MLFTASFVRRRTGASVSSLSPLPSTHIAHRLARVNNVASSRDLNYKRLEPEGWAVTEWIRANRHELQFGCNDPVSLAIEIPDFARYGKIIESILPDHALKVRASRYVLTPG